MLTINTILCPTDFSDSSNAAVHYACEFARSSGAEIVLLNIIPTSAYLLSYDAYTVPITNFSEAKLDAEKQLDVIERSVKQEVERALITKLVLEGGAADVIHEASHRNADLIVMGSHGRRGLRRLLLGSVAEIVLREAPCPVMVVNSHQGVEIV